MKTSRQHLSTCRLPSSVPRCWVRTRAGAVLRELSHKFELRSRLFCSAILREPPLGDVARGMARHFGRRPTRPWHVQARPLPDGRCVEAMSLPRAQRPGTGAPRLTAFPNPVPAGRGFGEACVSWSTGDGSAGEVWVSSPSSSEMLFGAGAEGRGQAPWIGSGVYEFRLYRGSRASRDVIAEVSVTRYVGRLPARRARQLAP